MNQIKGTDKINYTDILHIIFGEKYIKKFLENERCLDYTFDEMLNDAYKNGYTESDGTILAIAESPLNGKIYRYGNYGNYWVEIGTTKGYA